MAIFEIRQLNTSGLSHRCAKEQRSYLDHRPYDPSYCLELFRRALRDSDQIAWEKVYEIFSPLVAGWILRHGEFPNCTEEVEYFVQGSLVRFWSSLSGERIDESKDLGALLLYLKRCVHSEIMDHLRQGRSPKNQLEDGRIESAADSPEDPAVVNNLWSLVEDRLNNEKERLVIYASFFLGYAPREIFAAYEPHFSSVREVHRTKENVIARLKRAPEFKEFFDVGA